MIFLPLFIQAQHENEQTKLDPNLIIDPKERPIYFFRKGIFADTADVHYFQIPFREGKIYLARLWLTAPDGGDFTLSLTGDTTFEIKVTSTYDILRNELLEVVYTSDATISGEIRVLYNNPSSTQKPTYTLYVNRAGFAGLWWIILSAIGIVAILAVLFTFAIIGMISVSKKRKNRKK